MPKPTPDPTLDALLIRPSEPGDVEAITVIYAHAVTHGTASFELAAPDTTEMAARRRQLLQQGYPQLVAEADGRIVGYAYAGPYRPRPAYRHTVENSVYVAPGMQGRSVGRRLLAALIETCESQGYRQMVAVIGDSANTASVGLHRAAGFELVGTFRSVGRKHGRWLDSVLMQRPLGRGDAAPPEQD
jgi:phosphinothricin acetyltransferase